VPNVGDRRSRDRLFGADGNDTLVGGDGFDRIYGGAGNDTSTGNAGHDRMAGGLGDDRQYGNRGRDRIFANQGVDETWGGDGGDWLFALARKDVTPGPNGEVDTVGDTLHGENGNDRLFTRDGEIDKIDCGPGRDVARLDMVDVIVDATSANPNGSCEKVRRAEPKPGEDKIESDQESPAAEREIS
jgi:Ca2+-binding RTX toxin-like protein